MGCASAVPFATSLGLDSRAVYHDNQFSQGKPPKCALPILPSQSPAQRRGDRGWAGLGAQEVRNAATTL